MPSFSSVRPGDLMMRVNSNAQIREMLTPALSGLLDGALASLYLVLLLLASPAMGALVVLLGVLQAGVFLLSYRRYQALMSQDLQAQSKAQLSRANARRDRDLEGQRCGGQSG